MSRLNELIQQYCPDGVEYKPLGEVCDIKGRIGFRGYTRQDLVEEADGAITLSPSNITNQELSYENCSYISWAKYEESPEIKVAVGDVIFTKTASVGKTALVKYLQKEATINPQLVVLKNIQSNPAFLAYVLKSYRFQQEVVKLQGVGSVPNISQTALSGITIPVPPLPVQEEIARILDTFAELQAELQAKLQAELQKRLQQYEYYRDKLLSFSDLSNWGQEVSVEWKKLGEIATFTYGYTAKAEECGEVRYIRITDINDGGCLIPDNGKYISYTQDTEPYLLKKGDLVMARTGATYGKTLYYNEDYLSAYASFLIKINLQDLVNPRFYWHFSKSNLYWEQARKLVGGGAQPQFNTGAISQIVIPIPPLSEQQRIVDILDRFDALTTDITAGLPAEIEARRKQYEYYRDKLLTFKQKA